MPRTPRMQDGARAERRASSFLKKHGLRIIERNFRTRFGEIDIIAREGDTLVFVEVRSRAHDGFGSAALTVDGAKQRKLWQTAEAYLARHPTDCGEVRFDVVALTGGELEWFRDAFRQGV